MSEANQHNDDDTSPTDIIQLNIGGKELVSVQRRILTQAAGSMLEAMSKHANHFLFITTHDLASCRHGTKTPFRKLKHWCEELYFCPLACEF